MRVATTLSAITAAATLGIAAVDASGSQNRMSTDASIVVTARETSLHTSGKGPGAVTTFTDDLFIHGRKVGRDQVACVATGPRTFLECSASDLLPKGQIQSVAAVDVIHETRFTVAIVGGTGAYRHARGTIAITALSPIASTYTYHIDG